MLYTDAVYANICQRTGSISTYTVFLRDGTLCCPVAWHTYVDIKSVIDAIYSTKMVDDKRLSNDVAALKESLYATKMIHSYGTV